MERNKFRLVIISGMTGWSPLVLSYIKWDRNVDPYIESGPAILFLQFHAGQEQLRNGTDVFRTAFCLETQHFPCEFPINLLRTGEIYT